MKRITLRCIFTVFLALFATFAYSQNMSVSGFRCLENDISARSAGVTDINGELCALIRVNTPERGFEFTGCNIEKTEQKNGEIWLFVSPGVKFITIRHRDFGSIINYPFPESIKSGYCYELKLTTARIRQIVEEQIQNQYLVIRSNTPDAKIFIDGTFIGRQEVSKALSLGEEHTYRVEAPLYHSKEGSVRLTESQKTEMTIDLEPAFGYLKINTKPESGAEVEINGKLAAGKTPMTSDKLPSGNYTIQAFKPMHKSTPQEVQLREGETKEVTILLQPTFVKAQISCNDNQTEIYIDGKFYSKGKYEGNIDEGVHLLEFKKEGHRTLSKKINTTVGQTLVENIAALDPIVGKLDINSNPIDADVYIDGRRYGKTPDIIQNLIIGQHSLSLKKEGYAELQATIEIAEGKISTYNFTMQQQKKQEKQTLASDVETFIVNGVEFKMIKVEGGTFSMGATSEQEDDAFGREEPVHSVTLSDYYIGETEVTQELWQAVMGSNPSYFKGDNQRPVEYVSWNDCQEFIKKLNRSTGKEFRLPTEAEWEYAARGGKYSKDYVYKYSGSNNADEVAWYGSNSGSKTHSVKTKKANGLGLYDMSGNVWEWCNDRYGDYQSYSQTNPTGPSKGWRRVLRGGSWSSYDRLVRVSNRYYIAPDDRLNISGLRLALKTSQIEAPKKQYLPQNQSGLNEQTFTVKGVEFKMIKVEGGTFSMGATSEQGSDVGDDDYPVHSVTLLDYYIEETEVTQELWQAVMGSNPSRFIGNNQRPVEMVSWDDCQEFIEKLNSLTGKQFRLPTEAEWEYAARGGKYSRGYKYSGSNNADEVAWYNDNSGGETHSVKTKKANELGLYDMSGNVWEWCNDRYGSYQSYSQTNPTGPSKGEYRVLRGGSWSHIDGGVRVSIRGCGTPGYRLYYDGLRLAL